MLTLWRDHEELWDRLLALEKEPNILNNVWNRRDDISISQLEEEVIFISCLPRNELGQEYARCRLF